MKHDSYFVLSNGVRIPAVGFGTWQMKADEHTTEIVKYALTHGYSHVDTARAYGNEEYVGKAVRECGRPREDIFVTTKLPAEVKDAAKVEEIFETSLKALGLEYVDLYLIHAPWPWDDRRDVYEEENVKVWAEMEKIYRSRRARSIGISNFSVSNMQNILNSAEIVPHVNQIRYFIGETRDEVVAFAKDHNILIEAYSPLATGRLAQEERIRQMAEKYGKSWAQICLKFCLQNDTLPLPKTNTLERVDENIDLDFDITAADMQYLKSLTGTIR